MKLLQSTTFVFMVFVYVGPIISSEKQSVLMRKIDSTDRELVTVTITGILGDPISKTTFTKDKKVKLDWAKGGNIIKAIYKDGTIVPELTVSPDDTPAGSEITISKKSMSVSVPASALSKTVHVAVEVPNDGKEYEIVSGTEALTDAIATSSTKKTSPHVLSYKKVIFPNVWKAGDRGPLQIFRHKRTKVYVISSGCFTSNDINPVELKNLGSRPTLIVDGACNAQLRG